MKNKLLAAASLCALGVAGMAAPAVAESVPEPDPRAPGEVVDAFGAALRAGNLDEVSRLLDPHVVVLESGGAEHSREEYVAEHAQADAAFLRSTRSRDRATAMKVVGDIAWATSTVTLEYEREGKTAAVDTAETMILRRGPEGWKIVHIHWSSHTGK